MERPPSPSRSPASPLPSAPSGADAAGRLKCAPLLIGATAGGSGSSAGSAVTAATGSGSASAAGTVRDPTGAGTSVPAIDTVSAAT